MGLILLIIVFLVDESNNNEWFGFKIVGDNVDKNFCRTYQRIDYQTISHHFFHAYAVRDRVDLHQFSDSPRSGIIDKQELLPSSSDAEDMKVIFVTLISRYVMLIYIIVFMSSCRVLVRYMDQFRADSSTVTWHIPHKYSAQMKKKLTIVSLNEEDAIYFIT